MKKGFTLLEVLIGTAILSMMTLLIWGITSTNLDAENRVQMRDSVFQSARVALDWISSDLSMAFLVQNPNLLGVMKDGSKIETHFKGEDKGEFDELNFNTLSHMRMLRNAMESDQVEVGYSVVKSEEKPDCYLLMRRESMNMDNDITKGGISQPIAEDITYFDLEYLDTNINEWIRDWNTEGEQKMRLPRAVKIKISFKDPQNEKERLPFETIAFIELWRGPVDF